ncbi:MAG: dTDP-4-dehydrorhamnose 3,5-epimerase family protein [Gemmatimonadales bacterium]
MKRFEPPAKQLIDGVKTKKLAVHADERGRLMEMLRADDELYKKFGQVYLTSAYPGAVKAWHYHEKQVDHFTCVHGMMKVVLYDDRKDSPTQGLVNEFFLGVHNPILLRIPAGVYHGFKCVSEHEALIVNVPTEMYHYDKPDEFRLDAHDPKIPYDWARKDG